MKNLNYKQLITLVDDVLNGRWEGDTSKPIMIWFWSFTELVTVKKHLIRNIRELAEFHEHPVRHSKYMGLGGEIVKVADHPEYANSFILPSSFKDYTKGFLYHQYGQQLEPEYLYDCKEIIENTGLPLIGLVNDYEKEACEKKGLAVDMDSFVNYRYIGKTLQDWLEEVTAVDEYGLSKLPPCITDFVSDEHIKDLFFYNGDETDFIESDKRLFAPDCWYKLVWYHLWHSYVDYHKSIFGNKYKTIIEFLNGEYGLGLSADATKEEIDVSVDSIPDGLTRKLVRELVRFDSFGLKKSDKDNQSVVYVDIEDFLISGNAGREICWQEPMNHCRDFYNQWIEWLKARKGGK